MMPERGVVEGTDAVPLHPDGFAWSPEQAHILREVELALTSRDLRSLRFVIEAVAGSGKTTLLEAVLLLIARHRPYLRVAATAFNKHISALLKEILTRLKDAGFHGAQIIGGSNGVQAAGRSLLVAEAHRQGFGTPDFVSKGCRWKRLSAIRAYEWLVNDRKGWTPQNMVSKASDVMSAAMKTLEVRRAHTAFSRLKTGLGEVVGQALAYGLTGSDYGGSVEGIKNALHDLDALQENAASVIVGPALWGMVNDVLNRGQATTWATERQKPVLDKHAAALHKGNGDYLVGDYGNFAQAWKHKKGRDKKGKADLVSNHFLVSPGYGQEKAAAVNMSSKAQVVISRPNAGTLKVGFKSAQTATIKRDAWGKIAVKDYLKRNHAARFDGGSWTCTKGDLDALDAMLRAELKVDGDGDIEDVLENLSMSMQDMTWAPLVFDLSLPDEDRFDIMLVDEVQDLSVAQGSLLRRVTKLDAGWVLVGDGKQAIYGWAGAVAGSLRANADEVGAQALPMTVSWRNSQNVAEGAVMVSEAMSDAFRAAYPDHAQIVEDFAVHRASDFAAEGGLSYPVGLDEVTGALSMIRGQRPGSTQAVLARTNGALAPHIKACLKAGIPVSVPGGAEGFLKDVEALLSRPAMQKAPRAHGMHGCGLKEDALRPSRIITRLDDVAALDLDIALKAHGNDPQAAAADNDYRDRILLIDLTRILVAAFRDVGPKGTNGYGQPCEKGADAKRIIAWVKENLLVETKGSDDDVPTEVSTEAVHFSTVHRFKGAEADFVFVVEEEIVESDDGKKSVRSLFPMKRAWDAGPVAASQECNVAYVAWTRAKVMTTPVRVDTHFDGDMEWWWEACMGESPQNVPESDSEADNAPEAPDTPEEPEAAPEAVPEAPEAPVEPSEAQEAPSNGPVFVKRERVRVRTTWDGNIEMGNLWDCTACDHTFLMEDGKEGLDTTVESCPRCGAVPKDQEVVA